MANPEQKKIAFPIFNRYNYVIRFFIENGMGQKYIEQPKMTKRTMELGAKYSPDMVCTPFKTSLGSMLEALEAGADTLIMSMGLCRLGYYGELQETILRELGYDFDFINMASFTTGKNRDYLKSLRLINPKIKPVKVALAAAEAVQMMGFLDEIEAEYYQKCGFEEEKGSFKHAFTNFCNEMKVANSHSEVVQSYKKCKELFETLPVRKDDLTLRVGIVGEYFTVMDEFSNFGLEQKLADMGVEVHRWMNITNRNVKYSGEKNLNVRIADLCTYEMGPTSTANIWCARDYAEKGFDGIIHVKSAGCTPEIDVMPILQTIGEQYKIPILYLTYDAQTSDTGLNTRLEAFYDMIQMRRKVLI